VTERAAIVKWLRTNQRPAFSPDMRRVLCVAADLIERGEHMIGNDPCAWCGQDFDKPCKFDCEAPR